MNECMNRIKNGIITENPVFIMALGLCPTFAVTTSVGNAIGMGLSSMAVLVFSNLLISAIRNLIPDRVRLPAEIVVVASLVTIVQLLIQGFAPAVYDALGIYIPLIVVNCIILGRAEAYALKASAFLPENCLYQSVSRAFIPSPGDSAMERNAMPFTVPSC